MSLLPLLFGQPFGRSRIFDQHFGVPLEMDDLHWPSSAPFNDFHSLLRSHGYYRPWRASNSDTGSAVNIDTDKFRVNLDVKQFQPGELTVKVTGVNQITVEGKHEEKQDDHGFISRHFVRRYVIPEGCDMEKVVSQLSSDGVLSIVAPRISKAGRIDRDVAITQTGQPLAENKEAEKKDS